MNDHEPSRLSTFFDSDCSAPFADVAFETSTGRDALVPFACTEVEKWRGLLARADKNLHVRVSEVHISTDSRSADPFHIDISASRDGRDCLQLHLPYSYQAGGGLPVLRLVSIKAGKGPAYEMTPEEAVSGLVELAQASCQETGFASGQGIAPK